MWSPPFEKIALEADVLQGVGGLAVEPGSGPIVAAASGEIALGDPRRCTVTPGRELVVRALAGMERFIGLVEPILLEQGPAQDELGVADLTDLVDTVAEQLERIPRLLLGPLDLAGAQVNLGDAVDRVCGLRVVSDFQGDANCVLEELDSLRGMAEKEIDPAEVVQQAAEIAAVRKLFVRGLGALGIGTCEHPVALAVGDDRRLEVDVGGRALVVQTLGELERALDVLARSLEVAASAIAPRAPAQECSSAADLTESRSAPRA